VDAEQAGSDPPEGTFSLRYLPALDGFRAFTVLWVVAFHCEVTQAKGGFLGVDVFLAISGFLITAILLREHERSGRIDLKRFYLRRALRLLPALLALLLAVVVGTALLRPHLIEVTLSDALWALFYSQNWGWAYGFHTPHLLSHTWSLSLEEQFYVLWPLCLLLILRAPRRLRGRLFVGLTTLSFLWPAFLADREDWIRLYVMPDTRGCGLVAGCLLAYVLHTFGDRPFARWRAPLQIGALLAIALLSVGAATFDHRWAAFYRYGLLLVAAASVLVILDLAIRPQGVLTRIMGQPFFVWLGKLSYGIYLWHYPIARTLKTLPPSARFAAVSVLSVALAAASYYLLEVPCLRLKDRFRAAGTAPRYATPAPIRSDEDPPQP
jgi:peptidoglycan/LPS O-acetylase OafA/YrhL